MNEETLHKIYGILLSINNNIIMGDKAIIAALQPKPSTITGAKISQGGFNMPITGTNAGGQSTFEADALLNGVADAQGFPAGSVDTWTTTDPAVSIAPDSGPNNSQVVVSVPASDTNPSYDLTVSVQMPAAGNPPVTPPPFVATVTVPIVPAPPPVPTGVMITQVS